MAAKRPTARRATPARRRTTTARARRPRMPKSAPLAARLGARAALFAATRLDTRQDVVRSRKDAAILRATHEGCTTCNGNGQIFTKGKDGAFTGSKPCPAAPTKQRVSKWAVYKASRFGADKNSGLIGWTCPCGAKSKPRYRDAKEATKALRTHERQKHGGKSVGGAWYGQTLAATETAAGEQTQPTAVPITKTNTGQAMTDKQWEAQNKPPSRAKATREGLCHMCTNGALYSAFGGEQITAVCSFCKGTGKTPQTATA